MPIQKRMLAVPEHTVLASVTVSHTPRTWRSVELLLNVLPQTGHRLAEALDLCRESIAHSLAGNDLPFLDERGLRLVKQKRDFVLLLPGTAKNDPLGAHWSDSGSRCYCFCFYTPPGTGLVRGSHRYSNWPQDSRHLSRSI